MSYKNIKIFNKNITDEPEWQIVASEDEIGKLDDNGIYYYLPTAEEVDAIKVGDKLVLDEVFDVLEVEPTLHNEIRSDGKRYYFNDEVDMDEGTYKEEVKP
jgi:hypothetical protein